MIVCNKAHEMVVSEGPNCPLCRVEKRLAEMWTTLKIATEASERVGKELARERREHANTRRLLNEAQENAMADGVATEGGES